MRTAQRSTTTEKRDPAWWVRGANAAAQAVDHRVGWDKLPKSLGLLVLIGLQSILRQKNLHDTDVAPSTNLPPLDPYTSAELTARTPDGTYNDVSQPRNGHGRRAVRPQHSAGQRVAGNRRTAHDARSTGGEPPGAGPQGVHSRPRR